MISIRDNWRIAMLVVFLLASTFALFGPIGGGSGTQTDLVTLSEQQNEITLEDSAIVLENTSVNTTDELNNTVVASNATVEIEGDISDVTNRSAFVEAGSITVADGAVSAPANASGISVTNQSIEVTNGTLRTQDSRVTLSVESNADTGPTNLQYGFDLSGGTRIRAPLVGLHVTDIDIGQNQSADLNTQLAAEMDVEPIDVRVRRGSSTIEVFAQDVNQTEFAAALQAAGYDTEASDVRSGVTDGTRSNVVDILQSKIDRTGLAGGTVTTVGDGLVVVEVPNTTPEEVRDIVTDRGVVRIVAEVREGNTTTNTTVLRGDDIAAVGQIGQRGEETDAGWEAPVTVKDGAAGEFQSAMNNLGFTSGNGPGNCDRVRSAGPESYCLLTTLDGELIRSNSMGPSLADSLDGGSWADTPTFTIGASSASQAQDVKIALEVGSLPTSLDLGDESQNDVSYVNPSLAQEFKPLSLVTGLLAWFAVAGMVFFRYRSARVALPMLGTAIAEVYILLGFAAFSGLALNLSHIAGLIAVIGTGVDDLIIIADEILQQGEVATGRVFQSRFRKAFWVIGAAAATTIIAMSPLTFLSVGDLFGFAVVTIVGVLIGVIITRPAYGDILRNLVLSEQQR